MAVATETPTVTFKGATGAAYKFFLYRAGTPFKPLPGVYVFMRDGQSYTVIYVGQTENLEERFDNHHKWNCISRNGADLIAVRVERNEALRLAIENDLITAYNPPCNG